MENKVLTKTIKTMNKQADEFTRSWIITNAMEEIRNYEAGILTLRGLHYRLVARGMTNTLQHYKRVVAAMTQARWNEQVRFETFSDHDREMIGHTSSYEKDLEYSIEYGQEQILAWMTHYKRNRWEKQTYYPEVFIEKKALQGVFEKPCRSLDVAVGACKGYPSLTFLNDTARRLKEAERAGHKPVILYFGDYDPSGEDIPRSLKENLAKLGVEVEVRRIALMEDQVVEWDLPPAPAKTTDSRTASWNGLGQVELDALEPVKLQRLCREAIMDVWDQEIYDKVLEQEAEEQEIYKARLKEYVSNL